MESTKTLEQKKNIARRRELELRLKQLEQNKIVAIQKNEEIQRQLKVEEERNKIIFFNKEGKGYLGRYGTWEPNPLQKKFFDALRNPIYKIYALMGANRISKTFSGSTIGTLTAMRGKFPWEFKDENIPYWFWNIRGWKPPIKIRLVGGDWEKHIKTAIIPTFNEIFPHSWGIKSKKNKMGVDATWVDPLTGSTLEIMSNNSEPSVFEGASYHVLIYDEPPKRDIHVSCARGLIDYNGIIILAATIPPNEVLMHQWIEEEIIYRTYKADDLEVKQGKVKIGEYDSSIFFIQGSAQDNIGHGISEESVNDFAKKLTDEERASRIAGNMTFSQNRVLNIDRNKHFVPRFPIKANWLVDIAIDIGLTKPHDILFLATSENNHKYICFEEEIVGDGAEIADRIVQKVKRYNLRVNRVICDPLAKADQNQEYSTWEKIATGLGRFGYFLEAGSKNKSDGVIAINNHLNTQHGFPVLFFFSDLYKTIKQCIYVSYEWTDKGNLIISKKNDDSFENLYRLLLLNTSYFEKEEMNNFKFKKARNNGRNVVTGY